MGLLSILRKIKQREGEMRFLILGLDNAGKTTVVKCLEGGDVRSVSPTLGFEIRSMEYMGFRLNIWDVGGQESIRSYWRNYFEQTDALVWVVDSSDVARLMTCKQELHSLLQEERLAGASLLVLANKQDLSGALNSDQIRQVLELDSMKTDRHWKIEACSAYDVNAESLEAGFRWLVQDVKERIFLLG